MLHNTITLKLYHFFCAILLSLEKLDNEGHTDKYVIFFISIKLEEIENFMVQG